jgi:hypothetical protein
VTIVVAIEVVHCGLVMSHDLAVRVEVGRAGPRAVVLGVAAGPCAAVILGAAVLIGAVISTSFTRARDAGGGELVWFNPWRSRKMHN